MNTLHAVWNWIPKYFHVFCKALPIMLVYQRFVFLRFKCSTYTNILWSLLTKIFVTSRNQKCRWYLFIMHKLSFLLGLSVGIRSNYIIINIWSLNLNIQASCPSVLKRQIAWDIYAETSPPHTMAFGSNLPRKLKHIPPKNNTKEMWHCVKIPEDLRSMACVWEDIQHLTYVIFSNKNTIFYSCHSCNIWTKMEVNLISCDVISKKILYRSTKAFQNWLSQRPHLPMPPCLNPADMSGDKKQLFVVPSDFVVRDKSVDVSTQDLNIPISEFSFEIKEVLSRLLNE